MDIHSEFDNLLDLTITDGYIDMSAWHSFITQAILQKFKEGMAEWEARAKW